MQIEIHSPSPGRIDRFGELLIRYDAEYPFSGWDQGELLQCLEAAVSTPLVRLEIATLILQQLRRDGKDTERAVQMMSEASAAEIRWLAGVRARISHLVKAFQRGLERKGTNKVYFILLCNGGRSGSPVPWGLYVGKTAKKIEARLSIHLDETRKDGSGVVNRRGWDLLYSLSSIVPRMTSSDALRLERIVLDALRGEGSAKKIIKHLPKRRVRGG